ncbi:hypothetical protein ABTE23_20640, partial [Acinetobacter baumannii]
PGAAPVVAPAPTALAGVRAELPDFSRMSAGDSKGAAGADFRSRVGELFRPAPALSAVSAASSGMERSFLSKAAAKTPDAAQETDG